MLLTGLQAQNFTSWTSSNSHLFLFFSIIFIRRSFENQRKIIIQIPPKNLPLQSFYRWMSANLLNLNYKWPNLESISWKVSDIGINGKKFYDFDVRRSLECMVEIAQTNIGERNKAPTCWKMLKYQGGFFKKHIDHQANPCHSGVDVLLPPRSLCSYQGGELVVYYNEGQMTFLPHETMWTMIRIPLGTVHEVKPTTGVRIAFVRGVHSEKQSDYNPKGNEIEAIFTD